MPAANFIPDMLRLLSDVSIVAPSSGQALLHNGTTWQNRAITTDDVSGLSGMLASYATKSGGNSLSGDQTLASGSSYVATNGGDWNGVAITGTGLTGKDTSNNTTWSINSATGVITGVGSGLTALNGSNISSGTVAVARLGSGSPGSSNFLRGDGSWSATLGNNPFTCGQITSSGVSTNSSATIAHTFSSTYTHSSGNAVAASLTATDSTTGTGGLTALQTQISGSGSGSGSKNHYVAKNAAGTTVFSVANTGAVTVASGGGITSYGTNLFGGGYSLRLANVSNASYGAQLYNSGSTTGAAILKITDYSNSSSIRVTMGTSTDDGVNMLQVAGSAAITGSLTGAGSYGGVTFGNVGGSAGYVATLGCHPFKNGTFYAASGGMQLAGDVYISTNSASVSMGSTKDTGITRNAAGVLEINNGTPGTYRDLIARSVQVENGQYFKAKRLTGGGVIDAIGFPASSNILTIRGGNNLLADTSIQMVNSSGTALMTLTGDGNIGFKTTAQFGSGVGVVGIANATTAPTIAPIGGGVFYTEAGALKYMGSSGTITTLAAA